MKLNLGLALLLLAAGCGELEPRAVGQAVDLTGVNAGVVIAGTDFQRGAGIANFVVLDPRAPGFKTYRDLELLSADPLVQAFPQIDPDHVWVINRLGFDNIQVLSPERNFTSVNQFSVGNGSNPQDILVITTDKAYVTRYEFPFSDILIVNPTNGQELGKISLTRFASNPDQLPRPAAMLRVGDRAFIALQNLDATYNWGADEMETGRLVVVDVTDNRILDADTGTAELDSIILETCNPQALAYSPTQDLIFVVSAGLFVQYHPEWSGVEAVNPNTFAPAGVIHRGNHPQIRGNIVDLAVAPDQTAFLLVSSLSSDQQFESKVIRVSLLSDEVINTVYTAASNALISDLVLDPQGLLLIADRGRDQPALVIYDAVTQEFLEPIPLEPPPFSLALWNRGG